ncbi:hypothetical protein HPB52_024487 [Rhipicephalus sanguineus]|uniref:Uncharacterized protein n=1 Tax=Rhipicephalus sanguineus TaxID=34632 RepID=A0A9D4P969_RHISA|nr:hypothetical protein HPB52_024487 [Rhipicephalus sanguineus]
MVIRENSPCHVQIGLISLIVALVRAGVIAGTPRQLRLGVSSVPGCQVGVFASDHIPKDTQMGPYPGAPKPAMALCRDPSLVWEDFDFQSLGDSALRSTELIAQLKTVQKARAIAEGLCVPAATWVEPPH